jgi:hypothetical protein
MSDDAAATATIETTPSAGLLAATQAKAQTKAAGTGDPSAEIDQRVRPDWCPEPFYDATKGEVRVEQIVKSWREITADRDRAREEAKKGNDPAPAAPDAYFSAEAFKDDKLVLTDAAKNWGEIPKNDPMLNAFAKTCHEIGIGQRQFQALLPKVLENFSSLLPPMVDVEAEMKILDDGTSGKGEAVLDAMNRWIDRNVSSREWTDDEAELARSIGSTAKGVRFLSKVMNSTATQPIPIGLGIKGAPSLDDWRAMIADPLHSAMGPAGDAHRAKVRALGEKLFPTES